MEESNTSTSAEQSAQKTVAAPTEKKPISRKTLLVVGGILLILLIIILGIIFGSGEKKPLDNTQKTTGSNNSVENIDQVKKTTQTSPNAKASSHLMVYGAWTGQTSVIKAVDLSNSTNLLLATLPLQIKKVSVLTDKTLLYIDQVDTRDHGKRITLYNMQTKSTIGNIPASDGYAIDDYVLSPDKKFIAIWEVSFAPGAEVLQGGKSRVYAVDLSRPIVKNLIYDESVNPTVPVHYPRAVLNNGTVFSDTFMANDPNGGAGWSYGMSVADFDGTNKKDVESMKSGTYGTQPLLSPDGKYLLFSGYDGTRGDGRAVVNGYRQAILTPNTVELVNTTTLQRFKLPNLDNTRTYSFSSWDFVTGNVLITALSSNPQQAGLFSYDLAAKAAQKVILPKNDKAPYGYVSMLPQGRMLLATSDDTEANLGNLGDNYSYAYTQIAVKDKMDAVTNLSVEDPYIQYITILPGTYFKSVLGTQTNNIDALQVKPTLIDLFSDKNDEKKRLQLYTFFLKAELAPTRITQQSTPVTSGSGSTTTKCADLAASECSAAGVTKGTSAFNDCLDTFKKNSKSAAKAEGRCTDSPLYLYGAPGKQVRVKIQTPIYNAVPASTGEYAITLGENGAMHMANKSFQSIAYDYRANVKKIVPPAKGTVTKRDSVENVLRFYAQKLGLNAKETADLVKVGQEKVTTPYAFISFFNQEQSERILPIAFSPEPDNYLNVVFYFKLYNSVPSITPSAPSFPESVKRTGYTAVEVSEMVE